MIKRKNKMKAQADSFVKILFIVISSIAFVLLVIYVNSFRKSTIEEKDTSNFKMEVMDTLQNLVTNKNCLAYEYNQTPQKIVLDKNKIDSFATEYSGIEPDNAKALNFDYNIMVVQPEYGFNLYPGEKRVQGELTIADEFSSHPGGWYPGPEQGFTYLDCNFDPADHPDLCQNTELDSITCPGCDTDPRVNCPYPHSGSAWGNGICCIYWECPKEACESVETKPGMGDCGSGCTVAKGCDLSKCTNMHGGHGACGMTYGYTYIPAGETINANINEKVWNFGLSLGVTSFSPGKAKTDELQLSLPVTIRYNDTFSAQGTIYIYAVRGELESISSQIEDVCEKAKANDNQDIKFSRDFHFSYPVSYDGNNICMLSSCKKFVCPYELQFGNIDTAGDYTLKFNFDSGSKTITVEK
jgi:hypothetical protein